MKRLSIIFLAAVMVCLTACSEGNNTSVSSSHQSSAAQSSSSSVAKSSQSAAPVTPSAASAPDLQSESSRSEEPQVEPSSAAPAGQPEETPADQTPSSEPEQQEQAGKALVVYFSWSGNTGAVADEIKNQTGADSFELAPATPYTDNYNDLLDIAQQEQSSNARPAISGSVDLSGYDTIYLGYPNWWGDMPMLIYSFLDNYDLSGKTVAPFCTSGGSGLSGTVNAIRTAEPNAEVVDGLHIGSGSVSNSASAVTRWLEGIAK